MFRELELNLYQQFNLTFCLVLNVVAEDGRPMEEEVEHEERGSEQGSEHDFQPV